MIALCYQCFSGRARACSLYIVDVCMCLLVLYVYHTCAGAVGVQKGVSEPLELELGVAVSGHVGAGNRTLVLRKSSQCS